MSFIGGKNFFSSLLYFFIAFSIILVNLVWFLPVIKSLRENVAALEAEAAAEAQIKISAFLAGRVDVLAVSARYFKRDLADPANGDVISKILKEKSFSAVSLADKGGNEIFKFDRNQALSPADFKNLFSLAEFKEALETGRPSFGRITFSEGLEPLMKISFPVSLVEGETAAVLTADLNVKSVFDALADVKVAGRGQAYLVDETGLLINHRDISLVLKKTNYLSRLVITDALKKQGVISAADDRYAYFNEDGVKVLVAASYVPEARWAVVVEEPRREAMAPVRTINLFALTVVLLGLVLIFVLRKINLDLSRTKDELEKILAKTEAILKTLGQIAVVSETDVRGNIVYANEIFAEISKHRREELIGQNHRILKTSYHPPSFYEEMWRTISGGRLWRGEIKNRAKDDSFYWVDAVIIPLFDKNKKIAGYFAVGFPITERKKAEEKLEEAFASVQFEKDKLETTLKSMGDGAFVVDVSGAIALFNPMAEQLSGYFKEEVLGRPYREILKFINEETGAESSSFIEEVFKTGKVSRMSNHTVLIDKDGSRRPVADSAAPIFDKDGLVAGAVVIFRDVTREREIDRIKTEFISIASHQLRTPLTAIRWFLEIVLAGEAGEINPKQADFLKNSYQAADRMGQLITALLNLSRVESKRLSITPEPVDTARFSEELVKELAPQIEKKKHSVSVLAGEGLPLVNVDRELLHEILQNFLTNSIKYTPDGGKIEVRISPAGEEVVFEIRDDGLGIPEYQKSRVFEKFFRADNVVRTATEGTGLGLYLVSRLAETLKGRVWFESPVDWAGAGNPGKRGAAFFLALPIKGVAARKGEKGLAR